MTNETRYNRLAAEYNDLAYVLNMDAVNDEMAEAQDDVDLLMSAASEYERAGDTRDESGDYRRAYVNLYEDAVESMQAMAAML